MTWPSIAVGPRRPGRPPGPSSFPGLLPQPHGFEGFVGIQVGSSPDHKDEGYLGHRIINHSRGIYAEGDVHTNTIEGFFGNLKTGMRGAYKHVSPKYLQSYLDEYAWRHNAKRFGGDLFKQLLSRAAS